MSPRERFALMICLEITLMGGIVALFLMRNDAEVRARATPAEAFSSAVVTGAPPPFIDFRDAVEVNARFEGAVGAGAARVFELDPADRQAESAATRGPDFFLRHASDSVTDTHDIALSVESCWGGERGNDRVYVIEGNLWVHSHEALRLRFARNDTRVTFVVYGDVFFQDDLLAAPESRIAFVALRDERGHGGDIVLGDPDYFTLSRVDAWLYAEGDVVADELVSPVVVSGGIAAGGRIVVEGGTGAGGLAVVGREGSRQAPGLAEWETGIPIEDQPRPARH